MTATYQIRVSETKTVWADEYIAAATKIALDALEQIESLKGGDILKAASAMSEISEYVASIQETIDELTPKDGNDYEKTTGHEHGTNAGRV